jgi:glycerate 2-kinase
MIPMKIILSPQAFKGTYTGEEVCEALAEGVFKVYPQAQVIKQPVGDGGDGTLQILLNSRKGMSREVIVVDALQRKKKTSWGLFPEKNIAYIETSSICGIADLDDSEKNPLITTSYGVGECIMKVLDSGVNHIVIGLGGSATNDGGTGLLSALGVQFLDSDGHILPLGGGALVDLSSIDLSGLDPRLKECTIEVACDVDNPLLGRQGATMVYSEQKGASEEARGILEEGLSCFASITHKLFGIDITTLPYGGAAGGMAAGIHAYLGGKLIPGSDLVLGLIEYDRLIRGADLVITGEGRMDAQTVYNKAPIAVAKWAKKEGIPVIAVVGSVGEGYEAVLDHGIEAVYPIGSKSISTTIENALYRS